MKTRHLNFLVIAAVTGMAVVSAQDRPAEAVTASVAAAPAALLDHGQALASAKQVTADRYPDADTVLVAEHVRSEYQADGGFVTLDEEYVKVLTEAGRKAGVKSFAYNVFYGGMEIVAVEVIKADGGIVRHDAKAISKEQVDCAQMAANIYDPNDKMLVAAVPNVEIGDTLRFFVKRWESKPRMQGCYADWSLLETTMPIKQITYEYLAPKDHPLKSKALLSEVQGTITAGEQVEGEKIRYVWTGRDVPQVFPENGMPGLATCCQRLLVSTVADWKDVSRWYYNLCKSHLEKSTPAIRAKTKELTAKAATERDKIAAIFKFVSQEIRYMGITTEKSAPGYEPHDVNITFDNRYGVCRDKAALLVTMLGEAGIPAFPVIIMVGAKLDPEVPSANFNHAITAARTRDGKYLLMDSTNESTADLMPQYLYDRSYLVATPEGETLMTSPVSPVEDNMCLVKTDVKLADNGSATGTTVMDMTGINDVRYRGSLAQAKPDDIRRSFERSVNSMLPGATVTDFKLEPEDMHDSTRNIRITIGWSVPSILVCGGDEAQLDLPFVGPNLAMVLRIIGQSLQLEKRRFPLQLDMTCGMHEDLTIALPPTLAQPLSLPQYENTGHQDFSLTQTISAEAGLLKATVDIRLKSPTLNPAGYLVLKQAMAKLQTNVRQQPVFFRHSTGPAPRLAAAPGPTPAPATADVEVLSSRCDVRIENTSTWSIRQEVIKKILTYGGKKSNSELKFDFNPVWENVEIEYARVTQNDGTVRKIQPQEMNTLDADWVASAPRYPGAKTLVVSLPGVEVGSMVAYAIKTTAKDHPMFHAAYAFASRDAIKDTEISYDMPAALDPHLVMDFPKEGHFTEAVRDGRRKLSFHWQDIKPQAAEHLAPPDWVDAPDYAMSTGNWSDYATAVGARLALLLDNQPAAVAKARELVAGLSEPQAKLSAIRDFVARQIRATAPGFSSLPLAVAFSPADVTLKDGYGHSADRAILLHVLLKAAGFESELALAATATREPALQQRGLTIPENGYFDSLVCRVKHPATGEWLALDALSQYALLGATGLDLQPGYTLDGKAFTWSAPTALKGLNDTQVDLVFDAEGTALITLTQRQHGTAHAEFAAKYREMTPEERRRDFQDLVSEVAQNASAQGELVTDFTYPGTLTYTVKAPHYGIKSGTGLYFDLPGMPQQLIATDSNTRQRPLLTTHIIRSHAVWTVTAPAGLKPVIQPETLNWDGPAKFGTIKFAGAAQQTNGQTRLTYTLDLNLQPALIPAANYAALLDINLRFGHAAARRVLLR
ncbi:MAG: DUF3857 domain-containing protein [Verrucomicrobiota bacterium]